MTNISQLPYNNVNSFPGALDSFSIRNIYIPNDNLGMLIQESNTKVQYIC